MKAPLSLLDEAPGQIVEELGMARRLAAQPQITDRIDDPAAKVVRPDPVDDHPGGERIGRIDDPTGEVEAAA